MDTSTANLVRSFTMHARKILSALDTWAREQQDLGKTDEVKPDDKALWLFERVLSLVKGMITAFEAWLRNKRGQEWKKPQRKRPDNQ